MITCPTCGATAGETELRLGEELAWTPRGRPIDDPEMERLLHPMRPHRYRVVRLLEVSGLARLPRFAPPAAICNLTAL